MAERNTMRSLFWHIPLESIGENTGSQGSGCQATWRGQGAVSVLWIFFESATSNLVLRSRSHSNGSVVDQSLSLPLNFVTPWTTAQQASLSYTISETLLKLMSIASVMPSNHLILCHPLLLLPSIFPRIRVFPKSRFFPSGGQSIGASPSAPVLPMINRG